MNQVLNLCRRGEIHNKVSDLIKNGKCAKCNDYVSLGNDNHISTYVVHKNNGCWKVVCNLYSNACGFEYLSIFKIKMEEFITGHDEILYIK